MKIFIVTLSLVFASFFCINTEKNYVVPASKAMPRGIVSIDESYAVPFHLKWFNKDLNSSVTGKFTNEKGC